MGATCPAGHTSATDDYCDQCGARIGAPATAPPAEAPAGATGGEQICPICKAPNGVMNIFCEVCGTNLVTGEAPAPPVEEVPPTPAAAEPEAPAAWRVVADADPAWHDRAGGDEPIPAGVTSRSFDLTASEVKVGRRSGSRGIAPEVDLAGAPEDGAISHLHCLLLRQADGSYELVDPGSTNGTFVDGGADPIPHGTSVPVVDGTQIHIGAWTTLTVHAL